MKVLIIGLGHIAKKHIKALINIDPDTFIYALRSSKKCDKIDKVHNIFNLNELKEAPDFIIISNPTFLHLTTIKSVLYFKCPLFIEKPISHDYYLSTDLLRTISGSGVVTYMACNLRFLKCIQFVRNYIQTNPQIRINEINAYCGSFLPEWRNELDSYSFYAEKGGGVHLDLIHELDYIYWIWGKPAEIKRFLRSSSGLKISATDYANYLLIYNNFTVNLILNYYRRDPKRTLDIVFDDRTWMVDMLQNRITESGNVIFEDSERIIDTYKSQLQYFIECIRKASQPMNSYKDGLDVLKICLA